VADMRRTTALTVRRGAAALGLLAVIALPTACKGGGDSNGGADGGTRTNPNSAPVLVR
jgi:hypothetical protein